MGDNRMFCLSLFVFFLSIVTLNATPSATRDDLHDKQLAEIKEMVKLQSEMLQKYGRRIDLLERENQHLIEQTEELKTINGAMEARLVILEKRSSECQKHVDMSDTPDKASDDVVGEDDGTPGSPLRQKIINREVSKRVANVDNHTAVGFYSRLVSPDPLHLGQHQAIEFDHVITNVGNGYDPRHGHFTAPVAGLYSFTSTILLQSVSNHQFHLSIVKNGFDVGYLFTYANYDEGTRTVVLSLDVGDMVWVRNNAANVPYLNGGGYSTFSGFLITPHSPNR